MSLATDPENLSDIPSDLLQYLNADNFDDRKKLEYFIERAVRRKCVKPFLYLLVQYYYRHGQLFFIPNFALKFLPEHSFAVN